jgi:hypothetical protein
VSCEENVSVDIQKIKPIQRITGSQYFVKFRLKVMLLLTPFEHARLLIVCVTRSDTKNYITSQG